MANFNISIDLDDTSPSFYRTLLDKMSEQGFKHGILGKDNVYYRLPPYTLTYTGYLSRNEVLDKVCEILLEITPDSGVMVTEITGRAWRGLESIDLS